MIMIWIYGTHFHGDLIHYDNPFCGEILMLTKTACRIGMYVLTYDFCHHDDHLHA